MPNVGGHGPSLEPSGQPVWRSTDNAPGGSRAVHRRLVNGDLEARSRVTRVGAVEAHLERSQGRVARLDVEGRARPTEPPGIRAEVPVTVADYASVVAPSARSGKVGAAAAGVVAAADDLATIHQTPALGALNLHVVCSTGDDVDRHGSAMRGRSRCCGVQSGRCASSRRPWPTRLADASGTVVAVVRDEPAAPSAQDDAHPPVEPSSPQRGGRRRTGQRVHKLLLTAVVWSRRSA